MSDPRELWRTVQVNRLCSSCGRPIGDGDEPSRGDGPGQWLCPRCAAAGHSSRVSKGG